LLAVCLFLFGIILRRIDFRIADSLLAESWGALALWFPVGASMLQPIGSLVEISSSAMGAAIIGAIVKRLLSRPRRSPLAARRTPQHPHRTSQTPGSVNRWPRYFLKPCQRALTSRPDKRAVSVASRAPGFISLDVPPERKDGRKRHACVRAETTPDAKRTGTSRMATTRSSSVRRYRPASARPSKIVGVRRRPSAAPPPAQLAAYAALNFSAYSPRSSANQVGSTGRHHMLSIDLPG
jgi:hypothetical protein